MTKILFNGSTDFSKASERNDSVGQWWAWVLGHDDAESDVFKDATHQQAVTAIIHYWGHFYHL